MVQGARWVRVGLTSAIASGQGSMLWVSLRMMDISGSQLRMPSLQLLKRLPP